MPARPPERFHQKLTGASTFGQNIPLSRNPGQTLWNSPSISVQMPGIRIAAPVTVPMNTQRNDKEEKKKKAPSLRDTGDNDSGAKREKCCQKRNLPADCARLSYQISRRGESGWRPPREKLHATPFLPFSPDKQPTRAIHHKGKFKQHKTESREIGLAG